MKKFVLRYSKFSVLLSLLSAPVYALESMDDDELSLTTGEGIGAIVDNLAIHSGDKGAEDGFEIILDLNENPGQEQFIISELRIHKTGTVSGTPESGGNFGTVNDPVFIGDLRAVDIFSGDASDPLDETVTTSTVMRSEFPGASLRQVDRSTENQKNNSTSYQNAADNFELDLDKISNKFNLHWRFDDVIDSGPETFRSVLDIEGFRFYGTYSDMFATVGNGISLAGAIGLYIDTLTISSEQATAASKLAAETANEYSETPKASQLTLSGVDIYTVLGTKDQPLTIKSVKDDAGKHQLQLEISALPSSVGVAPKSDIYIKSIFFGDKYNPALRTGLRAGMADDEIPENYHYAFQPDIGNTIEIRGMAIQHLRITTMDI
jgi:hypothetical protein